MCPSRHFPATCLLITLALALAGPVRADIIHVPTDQPTIQSAVDAAMAGDEIVVAPGTYEELVNLLGKAIILRSADPEDDAIVAATVIESELPLVCASGEGPGTAIDGFTIRSMYGFAGMYNYGAHPTIRRCVFAGSVTYGAALYNDSSSPLIFSCRITENESDSYGGGILNLGSSYPTLLDTTVCGNTPGQIVGPWIDAGDNLVSTVCPSCIFEPPVDCNGNGMPDCDDIIRGVSPDCNGNGVPDSCDVAEGTSEDCDGNGIPDECDVDCNGNGVPDSCDVAEGTSEDCDGNGIPDECDVDCNGNGIADSCDIAEGTSADGDGDGVPDECETVHNLTSGETFQFVQDAIDAAMDGDEIVLFPGTYTEQIDLGGGAITLMSTDPSDPAVVAGTILTSAAGRVVQCVSGEGPDTVLAGLTITGPNGGGMLNQGSSPTILDCVFYGCSVDGRGGGMRNTAGSQPAVTRCVFDSNSSLGFGWGGGMSNSESSPTVTECVFIDNLATYYGGGLDEEDSSSTLIGCQFLHNTSNVNGGGIHTGGSSTAVVDCVFVGNTAGYDGGGVHHAWMGSPSMTGCLFSSNTAGSMGGGLSNVNGITPTITGCTVVGNSAPLGGGVSCYNGAHPTLNGCSLTGNQASTEGGALWSDANATLADNVVCGNGAVQLVGTWIDAGGNTIADVCEGDCNANSIPDEDDIAEGTSLDCNDNGLPDECDIAFGRGTDCNANGILDSCDIAEGTSEDCNDDGAPDECDADPLTGFALEFDGDTARVTMADFVGFPGSAVTVSLWMRTTGDQDGIFSYAVSDAENNEFLLFAPENLTIWINRAAGVVLGIDVADGAWHHVAVTWQGDTGATVVYVDGVAEFTGVVSPGGTLEGGGTLVLGQDQDCVGGCFESFQAYSGDLDEVRLWNVVRTAEEIAADRYATLVGNEPGLVGYWPMDEGGGDVAEDLAGENDGSIADAAWVATSASTGCCPADVDGSGAVDVEDLVIVIVGWGSAGPAGDVNGDGVVNVQDLVEVVLAWGLCK